MATKSFGDDIFFASISDLSTKLRAKEFSALELTRAFADRLESLGPRFNALACTLKDSALRKAKDIDGDSKRDRWRPLQGIPFAVKDLLAVKGNPTTWGARPYAGQVFKEDAAIVKKLEKAGAILIGKLAMVELAGGPSYRYAAASLTGPGLNPWDKTRWTGGSSSGSGAAVAAGLATFAIGSETSGSILTPSAYCGVTGLRPTYGLVSRRGAMALSWTMDKLGPMCRNAEDCALVLQVIAGGDNDDPGSAGKSFYHAPQFRRAPKDIVVGYAPADFDEWPEASTRDAFQKAFAAVKAEGYQMKEVKLPSFPYGAITGTVVSAEAASIFEELITSGKVDELADKRQIENLKASLEIPAKDYLKAMRLRTQIQAEFRELFAHTDVLFAPSRYSVASLVADPLDKPPFGDRPTPQRQGLNALIPAGNLAGLPAISVPCGFANGLPVAIQFCSRPFSENTIIGMATAYQKKTDWHRRRPAM